MPGAFCTPILARKGQQPSGLPLWAMLSCAASERPDLAWNARDLSAAEPSANHGSYVRDPGAFGFLDSHAKAAGITSVPLLVPCHFGNGLEEQQFGQVGHVITSYLCSTMPACASELCF